MNSEIKIKGVSRSLRLLIINFLTLISVILVSISIYNSWIYIKSSYASLQYKFTWGIFQGSFHANGNVEYWDMSEMCDPTYDDDNVQSFTGFSCQFTYLSQIFFIISYIIILISYILLLFFFCQQNIIQSSSKLMLYIRICIGIFITCNIFTFIFYNEVYNDIHHNVNNIPDNKNHSIKWDTGFNCYITSLVFMVLAFILSPRGSKYSSMNQIQISDDDDELILNTTNKKFEFNSNIYINIIHLLSFIFTCIALNSNQWLIFKYDYHTKVYYGLWNAEYTSEDTDNYYVSMNDLCDLGGYYDDDDNNDDNDDSIHYSSNNFSCSLTESNQVLYTFVFTFNIISYILSIFIIFPQKFTNTLSIIKAIRFINISHIIIALIQIILFASLYDDITDFQSDNYNSKNYYVGWGCALTSLILITILTARNYKDLDNDENNEHLLNENYARLNDDVA